MRTRKHELVDIVLLLVLVVTIMGYEGWDYLELILRSGLRSA